MAPTGFQKTLLSLRKRLMMPSTNSTSQSVIHRALSRILAMRLLGSSKQSKKITACCGCSRKAKSCSRVSRTYKPARSVSTTPLRTLVRSRMNSVRRRLGLSLRLKRSVMSLPNALSSYGCWLNRKSVLAIQHWLKTSGSVLPRWNPKPKHQKISPHC